MKDRRIHIGVIVFLLLVNLFSCRQVERKRNTGRLTILATTGMIADAAKNVAGEYANISTLMGPGVDPHLYKASHGDVNKITSADIVFYNGLHLEGKMGSLFEKASNTRVVVAVSKNIPESSLRSTGFVNAHDPHIWFDVKLWKHAVVAITETLQMEDSIHANVFERNSNRYLLQLDSLDAAIRMSLKSIPDKQRVLITAHDAFGYFGDAYGIEVRGLQGISTLSEFGLRDVTDLVHFITDRKIKALFVETSVSAKSIEAVIAGCKDRGWNVRIGGSLYSDAMGPANSPEGTYIGMVSSNVEKIVNAIR
jgi:manganese/zinc/iron transport system substrate-binding protein